jgi:phosphatidylserine/phosphatidylglycerophosphate/cardiolipin synthase-like enzyme
MPRRKRRNRSNLTTIIFLIILAIALYYAWNDPNASEILTPANQTAVPTVGGTTPASPASGTWWEVYFTDPVNINDPAQWQNSVEGRLIEKINAAQQSIHIVSFEFDLTRVAEALIAANERGVDVRWVTDDEHGLEADEEPDHGQFAMLDEAGIEVRSDTRSALMHNKFWIFDGQTVWTGSTNVTTNGIFKQDNNAIVIHSPELAAIYEREFEEMWNGEFGPRSTSQLAEQVVTLDGKEVLVVFTPEDSALEDIIIPVVNTAEHSIRFMAFSFTDYPLANAMIERARNGVDVAGVFETVGSDTDAAELRTLFCAGLAVRRDGNPSFLHHKVIVIDEHIVITGSLNYSTNAEESNDENVLLIDHAEIAGLYMQEFERVWARAEDPDPHQFACP